MAISKRRATFNLCDDLLAQLGQQAKREQRPKSTVLDRAIREYLGRRARLKTKAAS